MLFCNNKKNKLFKHINKNSKILGKHHVFCLNSKYPYMKGQGLAWLVGARRAVGGRADASPRWQQGEVQTEELEHSRPFQETKSTAIRWVAGELTKQETEAYVKAAHRRRNAGSFVRLPTEHPLGASTVRESGSGQQPGRPQARTSCSRLAGRAEMWVS